MADNRLTQHIRGVESVTGSERAAPPGAVAGSYERRVCTRPDIVDEIKQAYSGLTLPAGPSGLVGPARELRRYFTSAAPGLVAKLLYRALQHADHHANAVWYVDNQTKEELGLVSYELNALRSVAALQFKPRVREPKVLLTVSVTLEQRTWLGSLGSNLSENLRSVLDAAMGKE